MDAITLIDAARTAGFSALGMVSGRIDVGTRAAYEAAGLHCHELLGLQISDDLAGTIAAAERLARDAESVGATWVLTTFTAALSAEVIHAVGVCAAMFSEAGAGLAVEFSPLGPVATIDDGLAAIAVAGTAAAGLVVDSWNFCLGGSTWDDLERLPLDAIAYVQFTDALAPHGELNMEEAMTRRALPGLGVLDLDRFASTLRGRGWDGVVSLQVLSDELRQLPVDEYACAVHDAATRYWL